MPKGIYIRTEANIKANRDSKIQSYKNGRIPYNKGKHFSEDHRLKLGLSKLGNKNPMWKGGLTKEIQLLRMSSRLKIWREKIFLRDNFQCQNKNCPFCKNKKGGYLQAHHIKSFTTFPKLRFNISNGITYCKKYHTSIHSRKHQDYKNYPHV